MKEVIVIAHAPCSGGTFLTHWLLQKLGKGTWFIPETNLHIGKDLTKSDLYRQSPLLYCLISNQITFEDWREFYNKELGYILKCWEKDESSRYLLLRDWTFAEYFNAKTEISTPNIVEILSNKNINIKYILSHRDPIDCWLGLNASFPNAAKLMDLDEYVNKYLVMTKSWESVSRNHSFTAVTLEDLARHRDLQAKLLSYIGLTNLEKINLASPINADDLSSGASGRKYSNLSIPRRRKITYGGTRKIKDCKKLLTLRQYIGYNTAIELIRPSIFATIVSLLTSIPIYLPAFGKNREAKYYKYLKRLGLSFF